MGPSELAVKPQSPISTLPAARRRRAGRRSARPARSQRGLGLLLLATVGALIIYLLRPGAVTDDTYAFLDWGRDLRHGFLPLLENRTFQPLPISVGAALSLFGSAAPTLTVLVSLAALVLLAAAAWRIVALLGFMQPGPALAAVLVLAGPLLPVLALVAYNNLPFATLLLWAVAFDLERRQGGAWALLILAGLTRPEAWAFLLAYALLTWWRRGHPYDPRRWLALVALALAPMLVWAGLEWGLFGDPLYSLNHTAGAAVQSTHSNSPQALWNTLRANVPTAVLIASALGVVSIAWFAPRRAAVSVLGAAVVAGLTIVVLAGTSFNLPGRDFSVLVALICVLAAAGAMLPASILADYGRFSAPAVAAAGLLGAALVLAPAADRIVDALRSNFKNISVSHDTGRTFTATVTRALPLIDVRHGARHSVAMVGAVEDSELAWVLGVPYNVVSDRIEAPTRLIVEPGPLTWRRLDHYRLTDRYRVAIPREFHLIADGSWQVYAAGRTEPVQLGRVGR